MTKNVVVMIIAGANGVPEASFQKLQASPYRLVFFKGEINSVVNQVKYFSPDVIFIEVSKNALSNGELSISYLTENFPEIPIAAVVHNPEDALSTAMAGAYSLVSHQEPHFFLQAIEQAVLRREFLSPKFGEILIQQLRSRGSIILQIFNSELTTREKDIIAAIKMFGTRKKAAYMLGLEEATVKSHNREILRKLKMRRMKDVINKFGLFFTEPKHMVSSVS